MPLQEKRGESVDCMAASDETAEEAVAHPVSSPNPYLFPEDLIYGRAFFQHVLRHDFGPLFLHVQHESVQRLLYVTHGVLVIVVAAGDARAVGTSVVITTTTVVIIIVVGIVVGAVVAAAVGVVVLMILVHMIQSIVVHGDGGGDLCFAVRGRGGT